MAVTTPLSGTAKWSERAGRLVKTAIAVALGLAGGAALAALGARFGPAAPAVILAVPVLIFFALGVLADPRLGVLGVSATFPLGSMSIPLGIASLQIAEAAGFAVGALVVLRRLGARQTPLPWAPALSWALALLAWSLVALPGALDRELAIKQVLQLAGGLVFVCVVIAACIEMNDVRVVLRGLVGAAVVVAIVAFASSGEMRAAFGGSAVSGRLEGPFDQPNQLGAFCAITAVVAAGLMFAAETRRERYLTGGAMLLLTGGLLLTLSRGAWLGTAFALLFLVVSLREARQAIIAFSVPLLIAAFLMGSFEADNPQLEVVGARVQAFTVLSPYDGRDDIWAEAQREIVERPLTGFGPGNFPVASTRAASESVSVRPEHAHSLLLTWAAETGLPSAAIIISFGIALFMMGRRAARAAAAVGSPNDRILIVSLQAALIAFAGQGIVDYTLRNSVIFLVFWAIVGALIAAGRSVGGDARASSLRPHRARLAPPGVDDTPSASSTS